MRILATIEYRNLTPEEIKKLEQVAPRQIEIVLDADRERVYIVG